MPFAVRNHPAHVADVVGRIFGCTFRRVVLQDRDDLAAAGSGCWLVLGAVVRVGRVLRDGEGFGGRGVAGHETWIRRMRAEGFLLRVVVECLIRREKRGLERQPMYTPR